MERIKLELMKESWENLFEVIRNQKSLDTKGNFWAAIQILEEQLDLCLKQNKTDISETKPENQLSFFKPKLTNE